MHLSLPRAVDLHHAVGRDPPISQTADGGGWTFSHTCGETQLHAAGERAANMFGRIRYILSVNAALIDLGLNPRAFQATYRQGIQALGYADGVTPQATAVFLYHQLPIGLRPVKSDAVIAQWLRAGLVTEEWIRQAELSKAADPVPWAISDARSSSLDSVTSEPLREGRHGSSSAAEPVRQERKTSLLSSSTPRNADAAEQLAHGETRGSGFKNRVQVLLGACAIAAVALFVGIQLGGGRQTPTRFAAPVVQDHGQAPGAGSTPGAVRNERAGPVRVTFGSNLAFEAPAGTSVEEIRGAAADAWKGGGAWNLDDGELRHAFAARSAEHFVPRRRFEVAIVSSGAQRLAEVLRDELRLAMTDIPVTFARVEIPNAIVWRASPEQLGRPGCLTALVLVANNPTRATLCRDAGEASEPLMRALISSLIDLNPSTELQEGSVEKELNDVYRELRGALGREGRAALLEEQREWIEARETSCARHLVLSKEFMDCLDLEADTRVQQLKQQLDEARLSGRPA